VGGESGVHEYGGVSWQSVPVRNGIVRSLGEDVHGRILVGGVNELGYVDHDPEGRLRYVSLVDQIPEGDREFGDVWIIKGRPDGVFFQSWLRLFRWRAKSATPSSNGPLPFEAEDLTIWKPDSAFGALCESKGRLFIQQQGVGLTELVEELKRLRRQGQPLALAIVDLDHFKLVNDNYGHLTGDRVLVETAAVLQSSVRETDLAGRLGGEEFGLPLPGTDLAGARQVTERVRWHLAAPAERVEGKPAPRVTASIGLTLMHPTDPEQTLELLLARADALLYRAKREGRDRICAD